MLHGLTNGFQQRRLINHALAKRFFNPGGPPVFKLQKKLGGGGWLITGCWLILTWHYIQSNPSNQSLARSHVSEIFIHTVARWPRLGTIHASARWGHGFQQEIWGLTCKKWDPLKKCLRSGNQWIGLRENLQESPIFNGKIYGFL